MADSTYLFIDGAYLRARYTELMDKFLGVKFEGSIPFNFQTLKNRVQSTRAFYYDTVDDLRRNESDEQFEKRVLEQEQFFESIQTVSGYHVQYGKVIGKRKRQKQVDISLAVDMLEHAYAGNMSKVILLAGDSDFVPLVHAVVRRGVWVEILHYRPATAVDLLHQADEQTEFVFGDVYRWSKGEFTSANPIPKIGHIIDGRPENQGMPKVKAGQLGDQPFGIYMMGRDLHLFYSASLQAAHSNVDILARYVAAETDKEIVWE